MMWNPPKNQKQFKRTNHLLDAENIENANILQDLFVKYNLMTIVLRHAFLNVWKQAFYLLNLVLTCIHKTMLKKCQKL